ncbi:spore coat CotO family protein [Halobacillus sp. A1]|nr:spore coat CotO family protein [Halobacillus sp. A1]
MANKKQTAKPPLLYITQPNLPPAEVSMQTSFRANTTAAPKTNTSQVEKELRLRNQQKMKEHEPKSEEREEVPDENYVEEETESARLSRRDRRQRFRDMSLEEKVNYFVHLPSQLPKMKCEVTTTDHAFKGYIQKFEENIVLMKTFQKPYEEKIPFEDIQSIRLLGF